MIVISKITYFIIHKQTYTNMVKEKFYLCFEVVLENLKNDLQVYNLWNIHDRMIHYIKNGLLIESF